MEKLNEKRFFVGKIQYCFWQEDDGNIYFSKSKDGKAWTEKERCASGPTKLKRISKDGKKVTIEFEDGMKRIGRIINDTIVWEEP